MKVYVEMFLDHNLGDDLFLDTLLTRYPNHDFYLDLPSGIELNSYFKKYKNLRTNFSKITKGNRIRNILNRCSFFYYIEQCLKYDTQILIGGSIFEIRNKRNFYGRKIQYLGYKIQKLLKLKKILIGCNLGPFYNKKSENITKKILETFDGISVRELKSFKYLQEWKIDEKRYKYGSDIVFSNKNFCYEIDLIKIDEKILGISVVNSYSDTSEEKNIYIEKIIKTIKLYLKKDKNNRVKLLGFDGGIVMSDEKIIEEIYDSLTLQEKKRVLKVIYSPEILLDKYMEEFLECGQIIGGRFHSVVLALKYNKKIVAINYSNKIKNLLEDIEVKEILVEYNELSKVSPENILNKLKKVSMDEKYVKNSERHFYYSDMILGRNEE